MLRGLDRRAIFRDDADHALTLAVLCDQVCMAVGLTSAQFAGGGRTPAVMATRAGLAYLWVEVLGRAGHTLAPHLVVQSAGLTKAGRCRRLH